MQRIDKVLFVVAILFAVAATLGFFSIIIASPSQIMMGLGGEVVKNYYSFVYHALYDKGIWFTGLNYPYGEHIMYADGQPLFSSLMQWLHRNAGLPYSYIVGVFNLSMVFAFVLGIVYVYKILKYKKLPRWSALVFATLIVSMSPQMFRITGHYALSYAFIIPMLLYWLLMYDENSNYRYVVKYYCLSVCVAFIHPYYIAVSLLITTFYILTYFFAKRPLSTKAKHISRLVAGMLFLMLVVKVYAFLTDPVTDRTTYPYGAMQYFSVKADIISSPYSLIMQMVKDRFYISDEGFAYIGIIPLLSLIAFMVFGMLPKTRKYITDSKWIVLGLLALVLAMGIPFIWNMEWLMDYLSIFRQFRTIGRFAWIYYYAVCIYIVVWLYHSSITLPIVKKNLGHAIILSAMILWSAEALGYIQHIRGKLQSANYNYSKFHYWGEKDISTVLDDHHYSNDSFQAIIALPFTAVGSEKIWVGENALNTMVQAMRVSMNTKLPVVNALMSRTSWSQAFQQVKVTGGPFAQKTILQKAKTTKPFLLIHYTAEPISFNEKYLIENSTYISSMEGVNIYACYPAVLAKADMVLRDSVKRILSSMTGRDSVLGTNLQVYTTYLDEYPARNVLAGAGALYNNKISSDTFAVWQTSKYATDSLYEFSAWALVNSTDHRSPEFHLYYYDNNGNELKSDKFFTKTSTDNHHMWMRASTEVYIPEGTSLIVCKVYDALSPNPNYIAVDELMLRPMHSLVVSQRKGRKMANNHIYE